MMRLTSLCAALVIATSLIACGNTVVATQVIVIIDAEPGVRAQTEKLHIVVQGMAGKNESAAREPYDRSVTKTSGDLKWPYLVALEPFGGDAARPYEVVVTALDKSGEFIVQVRAISGYVNHKRLELRLLLEDSCIGVQKCSSDQTCRAGSCENARIKAADLRDFTGDGDTGGSTGGGGRDGGHGDAGPGGQDRDASTGTNDSGSGGIGGAGGGVSPLDCGDRVCVGRDGCCPAACTPKSDSDCPTNCGDGVIQTTEGETCETSAAGPDGGVGCPSAADCDDATPCTTDSLLGSAANCNAKCMHTPIIATVNGDMCCPAGANSLSDADCPVMCGNKVVEKGEDCDGSAGCDSMCKINYTAAQMDCLTKHSVVGSPVEDCLRCACIQCTDQVVACRGDTDTARKMKCDTLINCALSNDCTGNPCYCGTDPICVTPNGPCKAESEAAAGSAVAADVFARSTDTNYAIGRANLLETCTAIVIVEQDGPA